MEALPTTASGGSRPNSGWAGKTDEKLVVVRASLALSLMASLLAFAEPAHAQRRVALVIGNNDYKNVPKLQKAVNDARTMAETLKQLGFRDGRGKPDATGVQ